MKDKEYCAAAAKAVAEQLADNAALHVPPDPDVADFMGAFCALPPILTAKRRSLRPRAGHWFPKDGKRCSRKIRLKMTRTRRKILYRP
jgi:hypothetical protein